MLVVSNVPALHPLDASSSRFFHSHPGVKPPFPLAACCAHLKGSVAAQLEANARSPPPPPRTLPQAPQTHASPAFILLPLPKVSFWSHPVILLSLPPALCSCPLLRHTHGLTQLVRAQRLPSLSAEVAGTSHRHGHVCWVGTEGSLVRLLQTSPSSFPPSTFGSSPCPHLPVESRILPPSSLDQEE